MMIARWHVDICMNFTLKQDHRHVVMLFMICQGLWCVQTLNSVEWACSEIYN